MKMLGQIVMTVLLGNPSSIASQKKEEILKPKSTETDNASGALFQRFQLALQWPQILVILWSQRSEEGMDYSLLDYLQGSWL